jgi:hypothetical protein
VEANSETGDLWMNYVPGVLTWGAVRLSADTLRYDRVGQTIEATGNATLTRGFQQFTGKRIVIEGKSGAFRIEQGNVALGNLFVGGELLVYEPGKRRWVITRTRLATAPPNQYSEVAFAVRSATVDDGRLVLHDGTMALWGKTITGFRRIETTLPEADKESPSFSLPVTYRMNRVIGAAGGVTKSVKLTPNLSVLGLYERPARWGDQSRFALQYRASVARKPKVPSETRSPLQVALTEPQLSRTKRVFQSILRTGNYALPGASRTTTFTLSDERNREFTERRQGAVSLSRRPEALLQWVSSQGSVEVAQGNYRERQLFDRQHVVQTTRSRVALRYTPPPLYPTERLVVRPRLSYTTHAYGTGERFQVTETLLAVEYVLNERSAIGAGVLQSRLTGRTPFTFDQVDAPREGFLRSQFASGRWTIAGAGRWDLKTGKLFDYEVGIARHEQVLEPRLTYRRLGGVIGVSVGVSGEFLSRVGF